MNKKCFLMHIQPTVSPFSASSSVLINGVLGLMALKFKILEETSLISFLFSSLGTNLGSKPGSVRKKKGASGALAGRVALFLALYRRIVNEY